MGKKKQQSGFGVFSAETRPKLKEDEPALSFGGVARRLGEMWKAMSEEEKAPYHQKAKAKKAFRKKAE